MNQQPDLQKPQLRRLLGVDELAGELGISRHTIYSWVSQRRIPFLKVGRLLRFDVRVIEAWLGSHAADTITVEDEPCLALNRERCGTRPERRS